jgi:DNA-binding transcriptional LysR family regulator
MPAMTRKVFSGSWCPMTFIQLYYFKHIAEIGNLSKAAEILYVTQSGLSKSLHDLEQELGYELFYRKGKKLELNEYGEHLLPICNEIIGLVGSIKPSLDGLAHIDEQRITVDTLYTFAFDIMIEVISERYPDVQVICKKSNKSPMDYLKDIVSHETSVVIAPFLMKEIKQIKPALKENGVQIIYMFNERLRLSLPDDSLLPGKNSCTFSDLQGLKLATNAESLITNTWYESIAREHGCEVSYYYFIDTEAFMKRWVDIPHPFLTTSLYCVKKDLYEGFKKRRQLVVDDPLAEKKICMLYPKHSEVYVEDFISRFKDKFYDIFDQDES